MVVSTDIFCFFFFFNDTATTEIYTLSLHDALPILQVASPPDILAQRRQEERGGVDAAVVGTVRHGAQPGELTQPDLVRSEEHTSELQSRQYLVCRLLLEKKKQHHQPEQTRRQQQHR